MHHYDPLPQRSKRIFVYGNAIGFAGVTTSESIGFGLARWRGYQFVCNDFAMHCENPDIVKQNILQKE